jgi:cell pole-organizing protein PopZ
VNRGPATYNKGREEEELELTEIFDAVASEELEKRADGDKDSLLSNYSSNKTQSILNDFLETASTLGHHQSLKDEPSKYRHSEIEAWIAELIRPELSAWLDKNLPTIVKQSVSEEIKRLVAGIQNNKTF